MTHHMALTSRIGRLALVLLGLLSGADVSAQDAKPTQTGQVDAGAVFRVFLKNGAALPSFGESAEVGDRVVFTLLVGSGAEQPTLQLMSLPSAAVDLDRTHRYADSIRLVHYAATRGELDYAAMTQEAQRAIGELTSVTDPKKRLAMAREARARLVAWSKSTYGYRAADVRELTRLFDEVITELRAAAGERQFDLDLDAEIVKAPEPLMAAPTTSESLRMALAASEAADSEDDRLAILRAAATVASADPASADVRAEVTRALDLESKAGAAYDQLAADMRARASEARKRGDADALSLMLANLRARDEELGRRRSSLVGTLTAELESALSSARTYRAAVEHYTLVRSTLLAYERTLRPTMSAFDGLTPVFTAIRDNRYTAYERLERAGVRLKGFVAALEAMAAPTDLADVHATLISALRMADHACARARLSVALRSKAIADEASSAIAGALLLAGQARDQLVSRLYPPKISPQGQ